MRTQTEETVRAWFDGNVTAAAAQHFRLRDGKIEAITLIFDATRRHPLMAAGQR